MVAAAPPHVEPHRFRAGSVPSIWIFGLELPDLPERREQPSALFSPARKTTPLSKPAFSLLRTTCGATRHLESQASTNGPRAGQRTTHSILAHVALHSVLERRATAWQPGGDPLDAQLTRAIAKALTGGVSLPPMWPKPADIGGASCYLLFFDGASRENSGPGDAGAVIVKLMAGSHTAAAVWAASMAYKHRTTTNNVAEYRGLLHGLRRAERGALLPLHVIEYSEMVIRQLRLHKAPINTTLAALYREAVAIADRLDVQSWAHHYRMHNKMSDCAANVAMDSATYQQVAVPSTRALLSAIGEHKNNDVLHWVAQTHGLLREVGSDHQRRPKTSNMEAAIARRGLARRHHE